MALQTQGVHIAYSQKPWIRRAMWRMAAYASFGLYHRMLVDKRSGCFHMAFCADGILIGCSAKLRALKRPVRIVAIGALHQPLRHFVMKRLSKGHLHIRVTCFAELWL